MPTPRSLESLLRRYFDPTIRLRGETYFYGGNVEEVEVWDRGISATISGTMVYSTRLSWKEIKGRFRISGACDCPFSEGGEACKHLWALVLKADAEKAVPQIQAKVATFELVDSIHQEDLGELRAQSTTTIQTTSWKKHFDKKPGESPKRASRASVHATPFMVLEPLERSHSVRFRFFAANTTDGEISAHHIRPLHVPANGEITVGSPQFQNAVKAVVIIALGEMARSHYGASHFHRDLSTRIIPLESFRLLMPMLLESDQVFSSTTDFVKSLHSEKPSSLRPTQFRDFKIEVIEEPGEPAQGYLIQASVHSLEGQKIELPQLRLFLEPDLFLHHRDIGFIEIPDSQRPWLEELKMGSIRVPREDEEAFLEAVLNTDSPFQLPKSLNWPQVNSPTPAKESATLVLTQDRDRGFNRYILDLKFQYGSRHVSYFNQGALVASSRDGKIYLRNRDEENGVFLKLPQDFIVLRKDGENPTVHSGNLLEFVQATLAAGIPVEIENKRVDTSAELQITVSTGINWFDVEAGAQFSGRWVKLPTILEHLSRGERFVPTSDGTIGIISDDMAKRIQKLATFAELKGDKLNFSESQAVLLNAILEDDPGAKFDAKFEALRKKIKTFSGIKAVDVTKAFTGKLRKYQREGLGWLEFLDEFGLGGILADDMGLGKTVQCLAFLDRRKSRPEPSDSPSLLVAPKSLLENWQSEAGKFTPHLRTTIYSGTNRQQEVSSFKNTDLVITTYQTMLRDLDSLKDIQWDCIIADEAQAIKNPGALIAKAIKSIPAKFRLAMTGTPIENSIEDLFSISEFVNPGFLSGGRRTKLSGVDEEIRKTVASAFRPVLLRRTKDQVLKDLPEKTEQMISIDLEPKQLRVYNELKRFYQNQLVKAVEENGVQNSQIQILAALTRLRQAALHPGLIDEAHSEIKSSKFEVVLEMLEEILSENHRVLIFSQFTKLLGLLKTELKNRGIEFAYLDGKTKNRKEAVDGFKTSQTPVFLVSLKAGGVGLNLVEADYVFLLDPWWNPAVEAQAIDRAHRIGQKRAVNAYRFIAKGTVEEKIIELQSSKRQLAGEIIDNSPSPLKNLSVKDIQDLFA